MAVHAHSTRAPAIRHGSPLAGIDRRKVAEAVERLIALLDALDGDPDVENTSPERFGGGFVAGPDDVEPDEDLEDDPADKYACCDTDAVLEQYGIAHGSGARGITA